MSVIGVQDSNDTKGTVTLVTPSGDVYQFTTNFLFCGHDGGGGPGAPGGDGGPNIANTEGPGTKNEVPGYSFAATIHDHGEGCSGNSQPLLCDEFAIQVADPNQALDFQDAGLLVSGNIQIQTNF